MLQLAFRFLRFYVEYAAAAHFVGQFVSVEVKLILNVAHQNLNFVGSVNLLFVLEMFVVRTVGLAF